MPRDELAAQPDSLLALALQRGVGSELAAALQAKNFGDSRRRFGDSRRRFGDSRPPVCGP